MKASRRIKRAFLGGALLTIVTVMLMLGSTMAWFQDTEVVINTYTFGDLNVDIVNAEDTTIAATTIQFVKPDGGVYQENEFLFEPGATFRLKEFYIKNSGSVDLKYRLKLDTSAETVDTKLLEAMDVYATMGEEPFALDLGTTETNEAADTRTLAAGQKSGPVQIYFHMQEGAGNEYQNLAVYGLIVKVVAVQDDGIPDEQLESVFQEAAAR